MIELAFYLWSTIYKSCSRVQRVLILELGVYNGALWSSLFSCWRSPLQNIRRKGIFMFWYESVCSRFWKCKFSFEPCIGCHRGLLLNRHVRLFGRTFIFSLQFVFDPLCLTLFSIDLFHFEVLLCNYSLKLFSSCLLYLLLLLPIAFWSPSRDLIRTVNISADNQTYKKRQYCHCVDVWLHGPVWVRHGRHRQLHNQGREHSMRRRNLPGKL